MTFPVQAAFMGIYIHGAVLSPSVGVEFKLRSLMLQLSLKFVGCKSDVLP